MLGRAMRAGLEGADAAEAKIRADEEYDYQKGKRAEDDAFEALTRDRQKQAWNQADVDRARKQAVQNTWSAFNKFKATGDGSELLDYMQKYDTREDADISNIEMNDGGKMDLIFDDGNKMSLSAQQFEEGLFQQFSPEGFAKILADKMAGENRVENQKEVASHTGLITRGNQTHAAGLKTPDVVTTHDAGGNVIQDTYQSGKKIDSITGQDPKVTAAKAKGNSGKAMQQVAKDFHSWATAVYKSKDASGNFFLDDENGVMASRLATAAELLYRKAPNLGTNQAFYMAHKFVRENPTLSDTEVKQQVTKHFDGNTPDDWMDAVDQDEWDSKVLEIMQAGQSTDVPLNTGLDTTNAPVPAPAAPAKQAQPKQVKPETPKQKPIKVPDGVRSSLKEGVPMNVSRGPYAGKQIVLKNGQVFVVENKK